MVKKMNVGKFSIHLLSDGYLKVDGGAMFGQVPKVIWEKIAKPDRKNRIHLGLNCLLVRSPGHNILVDTGVGSKDSAELKELYSYSNSKLLRNLRALGLTAKDIDIVVLTHLHFDHSGGSTKIDRRGQSVPAFPKATFYIQESCWKNALKPSEKDKSSIRPKDFLPLDQKGQLKLLNGDAEVAPGVFVKQTNGHCAGHQIVSVNQGGQKVVFLGDLVPTCHHLHLNYIAAYDQFPQETLEMKKELLPRAEKEGWLLIFPHGYNERAGYLEQWNGKLRLRVVEL